MEQQWRSVEGYKYPYRISVDGIVQKKLPDGNWQTVSARVVSMRRACVTLRRKDGTRTQVPVVRLMANAFMGGWKPGMCCIHKNRYKLDCSLGNLKFVTQQECGRLSCRNRRKPVAKVDRDGNVIEFYSSCAEAARKNHLSATAIYHRCNNLLKDPFLLDGYNYRFER